jgi:predicted glycosyltransferase
MKLMVYCQHVLGIGHLCRIMLILKQLHNQRITLVLGGPRVDVRLPDHVRVVQLPGLRMDEDFSGLLPVHAGQDTAVIKDQRTRLLLEVFNELQPDLLLVELFPFGRNAFSFELLPLLDLSREQKKCRVACSVRDILVERDNSVKFEQRVIDRLNRYFHLLMVHGDPKLIRLAETFSRMDDINIPVSYTGYICQPPQADDRNRIRGKLQLQEKDILIVVSAGSGSVGMLLLKAATEAFALLDSVDSCRLQVFTGPYISNQNFRKLAAAESRRICVQRFSDDFPSWLAAADLSISMGGYNTTMNLVAAGCRGLIYPFEQNHEQRMRAERLAQKGCLQLLSSQDLAPPVLSEKISAILTTRPGPAEILLDGAERTADNMLRLVRRETII